MFLTEVPFKSNGKSARFFNDHVEFNGQSIRYDEVETVSVNGGTTTIHTFIGIPIGRSFDGGIFFKMHNGKRHNIVMNAMSIFGIPIIRNPRKSEKLFPALFDAVYSIVAKSMAQKYIDMIRGGATVEVAGLAINISEAISKTKSSKNAIVINEEVYRDCQFINEFGTVIVYDKSGETLWTPSFLKSNKNTLLIPYIFDDLFG